MEKEFIPYKQALALKELGFDEPCLACVGENSEVIIRVGDYRSFSNKKPEDIIQRDFYNNIITDFNSYANDTASAPTFSQAFRWFRDKYNIHAEITWVPSYEYDPGEWSDAIYEITFVDVSYTKEWKAESPDMQRGEGKQLTYEEAELECLKKLIEIVKNER